MVTRYSDRRPGENGFRHALIVFGPVLARQNRYNTEMLTNFASHGFVVVGTPVLRQGRVAHKILRPCRMDLPDRTEIQQMAPYIKENCGLTVPFQWVFLSVEHQRYKWEAQRGLTV